MEQLATQRIIKTFDPVFGAAIGRLERDAAISQCRTDKYDRPAIARQHPAKGGHGAIYLPEIRHLGHPAEFFRTDLPDRRENADHGIVHPNIDRAEDRLRLFRHCLHLCGIRHIGGHDERACAKRLHFLLRNGQLLASTGDQNYFRAFHCKGMRGRAPYPSARAGNDHNPVFILLHNVPIFSHPENMPHRKERESAFRTNSPAFRTCPALIRHVHNPNPPLLP